ncbi:GNAT family N-acetyltransferase [Streptomyces sp. NPDC001279]|uniref:GNAT family N-acetyltransferase n=1 Tax=Streptomyces sp. NPDC001279 TaxID=3364556 RepID=UPI0036AABF2B
MAQMKAHKVPQRLPPQVRDTIAAMGKASRRRAEHRARSTTPKTAAIIRPLVHADLTQVMYLLQEVVQQRDPEALSLYLSDPSPANRFGTGLVAEDGGRIVGVVAGAGIRLDMPGLQVSEDEIARRIALLDVLAVEPGHRRQGIGALLHDSLLTYFQDLRHRLVLTKLAAGRSDLVPRYSRWRWNVGNVGAGVAVAIGPDHLVLAEDPAVRTAWFPLTPQVRSTLSGFPGISVVTGAFD